MQPYEKLAKTEILRILNISWGCLLGFAIVLHAGTWHVGAPGLWTFGAFFSLNLQWLELIHKVLTGVLTGSNTSIWSHQ